MQSMPISTVQCNAGILSDLTTLLQQDGHGWNGDLTSLASPRHMKLSI